MKVVQVNVDYTEEVNSSNKNWLNSDSRHCDILVRSDDAETIKYSGNFVSITSRTYRISNSG